jgi:outer membrane protein OmpA-like peptidoglycan-associated protein
MEPRFSHDFSNVRVHTDSRAAESATAVNALAYTVGRDVVFGPGQYMPETAPGRHLLAHELTHVVQQASGAVGTDAESKAHHSADLVSQGHPVNQETVGNSEVSLQKQGKDDPAATPAAKAGPGPSATAPAAGGETTEPPIDEFEFDKSTIPAKQIEHLNALRSKLIKAPGATVVLTGHTDTVGSEKYNEGLGTRRAEAVRDFLTKQNGVNPSRIQVKTMGELQPASGQPPAKLDPAKGEKNAKNRRVEIQITGLPSSVPPATGWSLDPTNPQKKKPINLQLPPDYQVTPTPPVSDKDKGADKGDADKDKDKPGKKGGPEVEGAIVGTPDGIETTVEVTWDAESGLGKKLGSQIGFTVHVGPNGFSQLESDLTLLKKKIKDTILGGTIRDVKFSMGFNPALNLDRDKAKNLVTTFSEKFKATLEADLVIPRTSIKIPIELSPNVDIRGKPGFEFKVTIFKF